MAIQWTDDLAVGVLDIDMQHKELFKQINALSSAMSTGRGKEEIGKIIAFLGDYTIKHFGNEEKKMDARSYPKSSSHKAMHASFIATFQRLNSELEKNGATSSLVIDVNVKVGEWLKNHIAETDKQLGAFLKS